MRSTISASTRNASIAVPRARYAPCSRFSTSVSACDHRRRLRRIVVARRALAASCRHSCGERRAFRAIALQRPRRDREQHLQQAAGEEQAAPDRCAVGRRARIRCRDHEQDHAGQADASGSRDRARPAGRRRHPRRARSARINAVRADDVTDKRRNSCRDRGEQHAPHAQAVRPRLIGKHRVQRADRRRPGRCRDVIRWRRRLRAAA